MKADGSWKLLLLLVGRLQHKLWMSLECCKPWVTVRATTKLYTPATSKDNGRASSHCGLTQRDKLREKKEMGEYASSY